jgi:hypothetical protein
VRSFAFYSVLRLGIFFVVALLLLQLGAGPLVAVLLGVVLSAGLSYVLLRRQRDAVAVQVAETIERRRRQGPRPDADSRAEDESLDAPRE